MTLPIRSSLPRIRRSGFPTASALLAAGLLLGGWTAGASADDRDYLQGKLAFRYVHQPNTTSSTPEVLDNAAVAAGTETGTFWSNTQVPGLHGIVRALLKPAGRGGDGHLQFVAAQIIKILDKPVIIMLLNDVGTPLTTAAFNQWDACDNGSGRAWPCASNMDTSDDARENCARRLGRPVPARRTAWAGQMALGQTVFVSDPGWATSTFIHELVHTQDRSDRRAHMFWVSSRAYHYGADGTHFGVEAVPNLAATYQEGIANTLRLVVNERRRTEMFNWFSNNDVVYVEKALVPPGTGAGSTVPCYTVVTAPSPDVWLYDQLRAAGARELTVTGGGPAGAGYAYYRIRDLPARFIVHNEYILSLTFSEYARHLGLSRFMRALKANDATLFRVSTSPVAQLYSTLCSIGLEGRPLSSVVGVNEAGPKPYLIPLAYADYFTGFRATSKAEYAAIFENLLRQEWVDLYWDGYKDEVRAATPISGSRAPRFDDLTTIAITLGVNQSTAEH